MNACVRAETYAGTWSITPSDKAGDVHLRMEYRRVDARGSDEWDDSRDVPTPRIHDGGFTLDADAGQFLAQGTFNGGMGGGTWTFVPSAVFASELQRRGVNAPTQEQQFELAISGFKLATLDALIAAGFSRPSASDLVRMGEHGVTSDFVAQMKGLQFDPKTVDSLIRLRDHGVSPSYVSNLGQLGYHPSADELVRLVDHGVTVAFIDRMRSHGYKNLSADDLIRLRDHGF